MDEDFQQPEPKISDVEMVLIGTFYFALDLIDFIPAAGDITDIIAAPMGFYYWEKKLNGTAFIASEIIEAIPVAQNIPFVRTISWGATIWLDRSPNLQAKLAPAMQIAGALEGNEEGLEGAGQADSSAEMGTMKGGPEGGASETGERSVGGAGSNAEVSGKSSESENARPSERDTENQRKVNQSEGQAEAGGGGGAEETEEHRETSEDRYRRERGEDYEKMMENEAETPPIEQAQKEDFAEPKPFLRDGGDEEKSLRNPDPRENEATRKASDQFAAKQTERQFDSIKRPDDKKKVA